MAAKFTIQMVVFDLAGTTVDDSVDGKPVVALAFQEAFKQRHISVSAEDVNQVRGMDKKDAIRCLLKSKQADLSDVEADGVNVDRLHSQLSTDNVDAIFADFKSSLNSFLPRINKEIAGTTECFEFLKLNGICICAGSGFPHSVVELLISKLNWSPMLSFYSSAEKEGRGRPDPALVVSAMKACGVSDPRHVLKVGDTVVDVEEGKNAGCVTVAVLTGTQDTETLRRAEPDYIINSVRDMQGLLETNFRVE